MFFRTAGQLAVHHRVISALSSQPAYFSVLAFGVHSSIFHLFIFAVCSFLRVSSGAVYPLPRSEQSYVSGYRFGAGDVPECSSQTNERGATLSLSYSLSSPFYHHLPAFYISPPFSFLRSLILPAFYISPPFSFLRSDFPFVIHQKWLILHFFLSLSSLCHSLLLLPKEMYHSYASLAVSPHIPPHCLSFLFLVGQTSAPRSYVHVLFVCSSLVRTLVCMFICRSNVHVLFV